MSSIEFDEPAISLRTIDISNAVTHNTPFLIRHRIVSNLATANKIMIYSAICLVVLAAFIYFFRPSSVTKMYREDFTASELQRMLPDMIDRLPSKPR